MLFPYSRLSRKKTISILPLLGLLLVCIVMDASVARGLTSYPTEDSSGSDLPPLLDVSSDSTDSAVNNTGAIVGGKQVFWGYRDTTSYPLPHP